MTPSAPARTGLFGSLLPTMGQAVVWLLSILIVAVVTAGAASYFNRSDGLVLAFKQQQLADVQKFQTSGTTLDASFAALNDAIADNSRDITPERQAMRAALSQHAADAFATQSVFDKHMAQSYLVGLAQLRDLLDAVPANHSTAIPDDRSAVAMAQKAIDLIALRKKMIADTRQRIGI